MLMMSDRPQIISVCSLLIAATVASAGAASADSGLLSQFDRLVNPKVGQWTVYEVRDAATGKELRVRQAIVGTETVDGGDAYWIETDVMLRSGSRLIRKMLVAIGPTGPERVLKIIEKTGAEPARYVPVPELTDAEQSENGRQPDIEEVGDETIKTEAGEFRTRHIRIKSDEGIQDVWVSDEVGLSGTVRTMSEAGEMILVAYGKSGATSLIMESVQESDSEQKEQKTKVEVSVEESGE